MNKKGIFRDILFALFLAAATACAGNGGRADDCTGQSPAAIIAENPLAAGGVYFTGYWEPQLSRAPKGYTAFHISHYGRHGARYIIDSKTNDRIGKVLEEALRDSVLTEYGRDFAGKALAHYAKTKHHEGELTPLGWEQHQALARQMHHDYPQIFTRDAAICAYATQVQRCIMSMNAFCNEMARLEPQLGIRQRASVSDLENLNPHAGENPFRAASAEKAKTDPWGGTLAQFIDGNLDCEAICGRLFTDLDWLRERRDLRNFASLDLFNFVFNMQDSGDGSELISLFTDEEIYKVWLCDNYRYWLEDGPLNVRDLPLLDSYLSFADEAIANFLGSADATDPTLKGRPSALLRFSHDSCLLSLLSMLDADGFAQMPENADDIASHFQNFRVPMAATLNLVFYCRRQRPSEDDILVKATLCNKEVSLPLEAVEGNYYKWTDLRQHCLTVMDQRSYSRKY